MITSKQLKVWQTQHNNIKVIPNFLPHIPADSTNHAQKVVLSVGRLSEEKGFLRLIDIWELVQRKIEMTANSPRTQSLAEIEKGSINRPQVLSQSPFSTQPPNLTHDARILNPNLSHSHTASTRYLDSKNENLESSLRESGTNEAIHTKINSCEARKPLSVVGGLGDKKGDKGSDFAFVRSTNPHLHIQAPLSPFDKNNRNFVAEQTKKNEIEAERKEKDSNQNENLNLSLRESKANETIHNLESKITESSGLPRSLATSRNDNQGLDSHNKGQVLESHNDKNTESKNENLESLKSWKLHIVGDGVLKQEIEAKIKAKNLQDSIILKPFTKEIEREYLSASIYAMASHFEGFGMVLIESAAYELPSIAFDVNTGPSDIIDDGKSGYLVSDNDLEGFADKLLTLMQDENLRVQFGKRAKEIVKERFSKDVIMQKWREILG